MIENSGDNLLLEILKWVGVAFAAGFISYFGRYLSILIIERMRRRKPEQIPTTDPGKEATPGFYDTAERSRLKLEKKRAKSEAKKVKKKSP